MRAMITVFKLARPHFLIGGFALFALGAASAGGWDATSYLFGQLAVTASQLTAHFVNEYADVEADRLVAHRTWFSGGGGAISDELVRPRTAMTAALASTSFAIGAAGALVVTRPVAGVVVASTVLVSWAYSLPPVRLLSTGFGEFATSLTVAAAVPVTGALAMSGRVPPGLWLSAASLVPIHFAMMLAFEIPDLESDRIAGKRVLGVRLGRSRTRLTMATLELAGLAVAAVGAVAFDARLWAAWIGAPAMAAAIGLSGGERYAVLTAAAVAGFTLSVLGLLAGAMLG